MQCQRVGVGVGCKLWLDNRYTINNDDDGLHSWRGRVARRNVRARISSENNMYIYPRIHLQFHCHIRVLTLIVGCVQELSEAYGHFRYVRAGACRGLCIVGSALDQSCIRLECVACLLARLITYLIAWDIIMCFFLLACLHAFLLACLLAYPMTSCMEYLAVTFR